MKALKLRDLGLPLDTSPMEAVSVTALPDTADGWQFEPKWDGFRCLAFRAGDEVEIKAKSGKSLSRFFPEVLDNLRALPHKAFVLDGELVITGAEGLSFDALQMRLHPAESRIRKLARETPATLIVFDCLLAEPGKPLLTLPLTKRREALERMFKKFGGGACLVSIRHAQSSHSSEASGVPRTAPVGRNECWVAKFPLLDEPRGNRRMRFALPVYADAHIRTSR